jgi:Helix-turn-helix domain
VTKAEPVSATTSPKLAVPPKVAAEMLGISRDSLDRHVLGELRVVRRGKLIMIPVRELERWLEKEAAISLLSELR